MATPYVGEIRMFAGNFAPVGWSFCDGSLQPISEYETLFNLIGTTYGGDGESTFALPDLRGRIPIHQGSAPFGTFVLGQMAGTETVTLTESTTPQHSHPFVTSTNIANTPNAGNNLLGVSSQAQMFFGDPSRVPMAPDMISPAGGSQPHENMMPFLCLNFIISFFGIYPTQS